LVGLLPRRGRACAGAGFRLVVALALGGSACSDNRDTPSAPAPRTPSSTDGDSARPRVHAAAAVEEPPARAAAVEVVDFPVTGDEREALRAAGVVPAWDAVVDRGRYLARREQRGAVFGRLGGPVGHYHWLVDETEGAGALGIRISLPASARLAVGDRVVVRGAWRVDAERSWYFGVRRIERLSARASSGAHATGPDPWQGNPGLEIRAVGSAPEGAVPVSEMTGAGGGILFQVVNAPATAGDGWEISDRSDWRAVAILILPGENEPYGGQDFMTSRERWHLKKGVRYAVRIRRWRPPRQEGELPIFHATSAPLRIDPRAARANTDAGR